MGEERRKQGEREAVPGKEAREPTAEVCEAGTLREECSEGEEEGCTEEFLRRYEHQRSKEDLRHRGQLFGAPEAAQLHLLAHVVIEEVRQKESAAQADRCCGHCSHNCLAQAPHAGVEHRQHCRSSIAATLKNETSE